MDRKLADRLRWDYEQGVLVPSIGPRTDTNLQNGYMEGAGSNFGSPRTTSGIGVDPTVTVFTGADFENNGYILGYVYTFANQVNNAVQNYMAQLESDNWATLDPNSPDIGRPRSQSTDGAVVLQQGWPDQLGHEAWVPYNFAFKVHGPDDGGNRCGLMVANWPNAAGNATSSELWLSNLEYYLYFNG